MKINFSKVTEQAANIAIIIVAVLLAIVLIKNFMFPSETPQAGPPQGPPQDLRLNAGTQIAIPNAQWQSGKRTLILALSDTCRFCTESADFYKRLVQENAKSRSVQIVAVVPQSLERGKDYLAKLGVSVDYINTVHLNDIGVRATPTLIMLDASGKVSESWVGKLPKEKEDDVLSRL